MIREQAFYKTELEPTSFWSKITGQKPEKNAVIEINNLLSEKPILEVQPEDIQPILDKYGLNLYRDFHDGSLRELYKTYLRYCFDDNHLDHGEIVRLKHLKRLLGLSDKAVEIANHQVCQEVYERELEVALEDQRLDQKEISFLRHLQTSLQLPQELIDTIHQNKAQSLILHFIKGAVAHEQLSPEEEKELKALLENLNVESSLNISTQAELAKYRLFWQIENGEIPAIYVPVKLKPEEQCYFLTDTAWHKEKGGKKPEANLRNLKVKLIKGGYWKAPEAKEMVLTPSSWNSVAQGKVYITNERIILRNRNQEDSILLENIRDYYNYSNGVHLSMSKGKNLFLELKDNREIFAMILGRVLKEL